MSGYLVSGQAADLLDRGEYTRSLRPRGGYNEKTEDEKKLTQQKLLLETRAEILNAIIARLSGFD